MLKGFRFVISITFLTKCKKNGQVNEADKSPLGVRGRVRVNSLN